MKNQLILVILIVCVIQLHSQIDKRFWFAAPDISIQHGDRPVYLKISTLDKDANIKISIPALSKLIANFSLKSSSFKSIDLTNFLSSLECGDFGAVTNQGLLIESNEEITAYYEVAGSSSSGGIVNSDIYSLKGGNALGKEFLLPMQNHWQSENSLTDAWSSFQIVAAEDSTMVTVLPSQDLLKHEKGKSFVVNLNKGQVFSERALSVLPSLLPTGTLIQSNKNIAVTITNDSMEDSTTMYNGYSAWDMAGDQIVPTNKLGTEYIVTRVNADFVNIDRVFVTAINDNSVVVFNNKDTLRLNRAQTLSYLLVDEITKIVSNNPIYVFHIGGMDSEIGGALLPPIKCTGSKKVSFGEDDISGLWMSIVVKKGGEADFILNGRNDYVKATDFKVVSVDSNYFFAKIPLFNLPNINSTSFTLSNPKTSFQLAVYHASSTTFTYGYFSDFGSLDLQDSISICPNTSSELNAGFGKDKYVWFKDNVLIASTGSTISVKVPGYYKVLASKGECNFTDSTKVSIFKVDSLLFLNHKISICPNASAILKPVRNYSSYKWSVGESLDQILISKNGVYKLQVADSNTCVISDSVIVNLYGLNKLNVTFATEEEFCGTALKCIPIEIGKYVKYYLNDSLLLNGNICLTKAGLESKYVVSVEDSNRCVQKDSVSFDCSTYIGAIPNIFTPKQTDGLNDYFEINKLDGKYWRLDVFNRYGIRVYEDNNYGNNWDASGLENGVYFYKLSHKYRNVEHKGTVEVR